MGAGQIGGIATLLEFDFNNAAGFVGKPTMNLDGQYVVYYFSHAMLFCAGALIEPHMVLTPAICVYGEDYEFNVYGGSHKFRENFASYRPVTSICTHRAYNHSMRWDHCATDNIALLVLKNQFRMRHHEPNTEFIMNRVRYGVPLETLVERKPDMKCKYFGWGSRRNGFLLPLLIELHTVDVKVNLDGRKCEEMWNTDNKFLCLMSPTCINEKYGALCPDDLGSVVVCGGYVHGMMTSELIDRPCGVGFLNLALYTKFLECAVDDSRDTIEASPPLPPKSQKLASNTTDTTACVGCGPETIPTKKTTKTQDATVKLVSAVSTARTRPKTTKGKTTTAAGTTAEGSFWDWLTGGRAGAGFDPSKLRNAYAGPYRSYGAG